MPYHISKYCSHISKALVYSQFVLALCGKNNNCKVVPRRCGQRANVRPRSDYFLRIRLMPSRRGIMTFSTRGSCDIIWLKAWMPIV